MRAPRPNHALPRPAIASQLQSSALVGRVAELGSLGGFTRMHLSLKAVVVVSLILIVCGAARASEITHDWSIGGWVHKGIGFVGMKHGDGTVQTEFRYGHGAFDYITFPFHIYWVVVIANLPVLFSIAFFLMPRYCRRHANTA